MDGFWLEAVGLSFAGTSALVWCRLKSSGTLQKHGLIEQSADNLRDSLGALCRKKLEQFEEEIIFRIRVGHGRARVGWVEVVTFKPNLL